MRPSISAVILTKNSAATIARCIGSLGWTNEVLVVDAVSDDNTQSIAKGLGARVIERAWTGFKDQRNFSLTSATHDWILVVDSDEECSPELAEKIQSILGQPRPHRYWKVRRIEYFLGKQIKHGIWNPSYQDRFFHRAGVKYVNDIHEYPIFPQAPALIHEPLHHWPDFSPEVFLDKLNRYTTIEAKNRVDNGQRTNVFRLFFAMPAMFFKNYFYYGAYRDGMHGFIISLLEGISRAVRHIKIWRFSREVQR